MVSIRGIPQALQMRKMFPQATNILAGLTRLVCARDAPGAWAAILISVHVNSIRCPHFLYVIPACFWRGSRHSKTTGFPPGACGDDDSTGHSMV